MWQHAGVAALNEVTRVQGCYRGDVHTHIRACMRCSSYTGAAGIRTVKILLIAMCNDRLYLFLARCRTLTPKRGELNNVPIEVSAAPRGTSPSKQSPSTRRRGKLIRLHVYIQTVMIAFAQLLPAISSFCGTRIDTDAYWGKKNARLAIIRISLSELNN